MSFGNTRSQIKTETLSNLIRVAGLSLCVLRHWFLLIREGMGHVAAEFLAERGSQLSVRWPAL
jgi:hypothetical protein